MRWLLVALLCLPALSAVHATEWYPGIIHLHTQFSDGVLPPAALAVKAEAVGAKFIIVTDHYDEINQQVKWGTPFSLALGAPALREGLPRGFDRYYKEIDSLTREGVFVAIPGAEIGARWYPEQMGVKGWKGPTNEASAHTLALGVIRELDSQVRDEYCEKLGKQQDVINKIRQWGKLPVAAHPSFLHDGRPGGLSLLGRVDYRYDKRPADQAADGLVQYKGLAGVEMWNVDKAEQRQEDLDFYLRLIREGYRPFVTAGSDYHSYKPWEDQTLHRKTWVYADNLTTDGILKAIAGEKTYAAQGRAQFEDLSPLPGERKEMNRPVIQAKVRFPLLTNPEKAFSIYRDGELVHTGRLRLAGISLTAQSYRAEWTDSTARPGNHTYVLVIKDAIVTSPMDVVVPPLGSPSQALLKSFLSRLQD